MKKIFTILGIVSIATLANAQIVINEVYGGGGNAQAAFKNDFVELVNRGSATVTLTGASLQYASAEGNFNSYQPLPDITLLPGQKYLIQEAPGNGNGADLPTPDYAPTTNISFSNGNTYNTALNFAGSNGKVALVNDLNQISSATDSNVIDFVGYGTANAYEGSGAAPAPTNASSVTRTNGIDTNNNAADFTVSAPPTPENSSTLAVSDVSAIKASLVKNTLVNESLAFSKSADIQIINAAGQVVKTAKVTEGTALDVSSLAKGMYIVTGTVNGEAVSQKIIKK